MPVFADSHVHLADPAFETDRDAVIEAARQAGARALVCIGETPDAADRARAVALRHPGFVWHTAGMHPHEAAAFDRERDLPRIREHIEQGAVAIGECGLDYHYDNSPRDVQRAVFQAQLQLAAETGKPLVVHSREAVDDTVAMVREAGESGVRGVLHCFTGPATLAEVALTAGWCVSFAGVITFKKWADDGLIRSIPTDRTLVESDAPYLAPVPYRGKRNEPSHVLLTLTHVAQARALDVETMAEMTLDNAARLFGLAVKEARP
ncbi:MAG TPA: TatD family hydrolase [Gemmatimonadaceae bacterium]|nr:TatD family hydrolase [Gemmatimonadaceae bacterium]